jgi:hypothetical protein
MFAFVDSAIRTLLARLNPCGFQKGRVYALSIESGFCAFCSLVREHERGVLPLVLYDCQEVLYIYDFECCLLCSICLLL